VTTSDLILVVLWLLVTGTGVVLTARMMVLTKSDGEFLKDKNIDGAAAALTTLAFWQEFRRFFVKVFLFAVGLSAFFEPPVPDICKVHSSWSWIFIACLLASCCF
jgi:thiosulfate reductase cytochrome b subunit